MGTRQLWEHTWGDQRRKWWLRQRQDPCLKMNENHPGDAETAAKKMPAMQAGGLKSGSLLPS